MDARDSLSHMETLVGLLRELAGRGIALYEHRFDAQALGNFDVVLGVPHRRVKFTWDARDSLLSISVGKFQNASGPGDWVHEMDVDLPRGDGLYEEIASNVVDILAI
jgi:hypothetical protein